MLRNTAIGALLCFLLLFSACSSVPDHANLIPKDAVMVAGIHTTSIGKKIAWDAIMGSKLIEKLKENNKDQNGMVDDLQKAGIKGLTTFYVYMQPDARFANGNRITALVPLDDASLWTAYVKKVFPQAKVSQTGNYQEALLANGLYAGWSKDMLIVINPLSGAEADSTGAVMAPAIDDAQLAAEMAAAFKVPEENSLARNKRFAELEKGSHDITLWINYDALIERSMSGKEMQNMMGGFSLSNNLWKDVSFAGGFDFDEGKIAGEMKCYMSEAMQKIGEDLGKTAIDKEILENLPSQDRNLLFAWHIAPAGLKGTLEKMGVLGILNLSLTGQGMSVDYILEAFTGDVALSMNEFKVDKTTIAIPDSLRVADSVATALKPEFAYVFAMKINKAENLKKLLQMAVAQKGIRPEGNNTYVVMNSPSLILLHNEKYLVLANKAANATNFINGGFKGGAGSPSVKTVSGNPFGLYIHIDSTLNGMDETIVTGQKNIAMLSASKNLIRNVVLKGGQYKDMAFRYDMSIDFVNKEENSLLQIIDFANSMNGISEHN